MKKKNVMTSIVSSFTILVIILILLVAFCSMMYNQYQTNSKIQAILDYFAIVALEGMPKASADNVSDSSDTAVSVLEYSGAIAYLSKIQEVVSSNNSSSLLALIYTIISSLVLTYGAKMLRLGENDKTKLVHEISERSRSDICAIENRLTVKSSISNAIVSINSATSSLQLLIFALTIGSEEALEEINTSYMGNLSLMNNELRNVVKTLDKLSVGNIDINGLNNALALFEKHYDLYKTINLPASIDDKRAAETKVKESMEAHDKICDRLTAINSNQAK